VCLKECGGVSQGVCVCVSRSVCVCLKECVCVSRSVCVCLKVHVVKQLGFNTYITYKRDYTLYMCI
jgi:hypothetical protein